MQQASGVLPVEGFALSEITRPIGVSTGHSVLDDFLPWQGLPLGGLTLIDGPQAPRLARRMSSRLAAPGRALWIHSLRTRPFFQESESCLRLQVPEEADSLQVLPQVLADAAFSCVILQLTHPLSRPKAMELARGVRQSQVSVVVNAKSERTLPWDLCDLVIESNDDFLAIRKAQHRPVPLWVPVEMINLAPGIQETPVLSWWNALEHAI
jgi:hypothetical protein